MLVKMYFKICLNMKKINNEESQFLPSLEIVPKN